MQRKIILQVDVLLLLGLLWLPSRAKPLVPALFIFGDSIVDVGTNYYVRNSKLIANYPPHGITHFGHPNGRYCDGLIPADFLAWHLQLPTLPPYLQPNANHSLGANFASSGAGLLDVTNGDKVVIPYSLQVKQFQKLVKKWKTEHPESAIREKISKSIIHINIGSNDIITTYLRNESLQTEVSPGDFVTSLIPLYNTSIKALYAAGARKFAISELGPLGCTPASRMHADLDLKTRGCFNTSNQMALNFNRRLNTILAELKAELPAAKFITAKAYQIYMDMIENGTTKYGFRETRANCCGSGKYNAQVPCGIQPPITMKPFLCSDRSKYLFWDLHPTQEGYMYYSMSFWNGTRDVVSPFNLQTLASL